MNFVHKILLILSLVLIGTCDFNLLQAEEQFLNPEEILDLEKKGSEQKSPEVEQEVPRLIEDKKLLIVDKQPPENFLSEQSSDVIVKKKDKKNNQTLSSKLIPASTNKIKEDLGIKTNRIDPSILAMVNKNLPEKCQDPSKSYPNKKRQMAVISKIDFTGSFTSVQKAALTNRFKYLLSNYFNLVPASVTGVERKLVLTGIKNEQFSQLTVNLDISGRGYFEELACSGCSLTLLYKNVDKLVENVLINDSMVSIQPGQKIDSLLPAEEPSLFKKYKWHITASSIAVGFFLLSMNESSSYNSYADKNKSLNNSLSSATSSSEIDQLSDKIQDNNANMRSHKANYDYLTLFSLIGLGWEGYLLYQHYQNKKKAEQKNDQEGVVFSFYHRPEIKESRLQLELRF